MPLLIQFFSGINRLTDFEGIANAGAVVGAQVCHLKGSFGDAVLEHLRKGGSIFLDSGAFPAFMPGGAPVDFDTVMEAYEHVAAAAQRPEALYLVAPDKVGDPIETLRLLRQFEPRIRALALAGVSIIVPVQLGSSSLTATWAEIRQALNGIPIIPGMPMRAAAVTIDHVIAFLQATGEKRVHLLGTSRQAHFNQIDFFCPNVSITADANRIRASVGANRELTKNYRQRLHDACCDEWYEGGEMLDSTEFTGFATSDPKFLTPSETAQVAQFVKEITGDDVLEQIRRTPMAEVLEPELLDLVYEYSLLEIHRARAARLIGPKIRSLALTDYFSKEAASSDQSGQIVSINEAQPSVAA